MVTVKSKDTTLPIFQAAFKVAVWENIAIVEAITEVVRNAGFYLDENEKPEERLRNINGPYGKVYWKLLKQRGKKSRLVTKDGYRRGFEAV